MPSTSYTVYEPTIIKSADGTNICADAIGSRAAGSPVLVLIHGFSVVKEAFDPIFHDPKWIHHAFLVRYDTRGHGKSDKPLEDSRWHSQRMAEDFEAVCKEFGVEKAFVLGWSLGGTSLHFSVESAEMMKVSAAFFADLVNFTKSVNISGFINVAGPPYIDQGLFARVAASSTLEILVALSQPSSVDVFQENTLKLIRTLSSVMSPDLFRTLLEGVIIQPRAITARIVSRKQDPTRLVQEGREGKIDTLVITGGRDILINVPGLKAVYEDLGLQKCTMKHLEEADHVPWVSSRDEFRETVLGCHLQLVGPLTFQPCASGFSHIIYSLLALTNTLNTVRLSSLRRYNQFVRSSRVTMPVPKLQWKTPTPQGVVVMVLLENSPAMANIWNEREIKHFGMSTKKIVRSNHVTGPEDDDDDSTGDNFNSALESVKFTSCPDNIITGTIIKQSIDILSSARKKGCRSMLHLIIVSTRPVMLETSTWSQQGCLISQRAWCDKQAQQLKEANIRCHLVHRPSQDMLALSLLFNTAMKMQNLVEETLSLPAGSALDTELMSTMTARLATAGSPRMTESEPSVQTRERARSSGNASPLDSPNSTLIRRESGTLVPRTSSGRLSGSAPPKPSRPSTLSAAESSGELSQTSTSPNIVARLQQLHGLTKKKLYSSASRPPARTPFVSDEPTNKPHQAPSRPLIPRDVEEYITQSHSLSNPGGKVQMKYKEERRIRLTQRNITNPQPARKGKSSPSPLSFAIHRPNTMTPPPPQPICGTFAPNTRSNPSDVVLQGALYEVPRSSSSSFLDHGKTSNIVPQDSIGSSSGRLPPTVYDLHIPPSLVGSISLSTASNNPTASPEPLTDFSLSTHNPPIGGAATSISHSWKATHFTGTESWAQSASQASDPPVSYRWNRAEDHDFIAPVSSHPLNGCVECQDGTGTTVLEGNENTQEAGSYLLDQPQYFCPNRLDVSVNSSQSHVLPIPESNHAKVKALTSATTGANSGMSEVDSEERITQTSMLFYRGLSKEQELYSMPQFYPSSSSSLSAMINPRPDGFSSG
ncbi:hypothetical protein NP233_g4963 [Leucocoprinus birnbaumii]|uniref:AB hydrolase-1 domain-containing protein n=1 Tax=Leucocoprinus birnbaumii TaxID=56174 RepID=A0AAD5YRD0_9AGAR|nr:hypothetical protein NP233_g4963 [Leucocoprinus birnbaumii]